MYSSSKRQRHPVWSLHLKVHLAYKRAKPIGAPSLPQPPRQYPSRRRNLPERRRRHQDNRAPAIFQHPTSYQQLHTPPGSPRLAGGVSYFITHVFPSESPPSEAERSASMARLQLRAPLATAAPARAARAAPIAPSQQSIAGGHQSAGDSTKPIGAPAPPQPPIPHQQFYFQSALERLAVRIPHL